MKKILFAVLLFAFAHDVFGQGINFQGVARSANGTILANQKISLKLSIITGTNTSTPDYIETRSVATNTQGIFSVVVGDTGTTTTIGTYSSISWKISSKFLKVEMDPNNGINFISMGTTPLQYVPFSYYSNGVDATNVAGVLPLKSGGTGVASISDLKVALLLDKVNNTADLDKPISTITQTVLDSKLSKSDTASLSYRINKIKTSIINFNDTLGNFGMGDSTLFSNIPSDTGAYSNTAIGWKTLRYNKTGGLNTAIGSSALYSNTTGGGNTANGANALFTNTEGYNNTAYGYYSLYSNISGGRNVAIGHYSLYNNTMGNDNVAIGPFVMRSNTSGYSNVAIGRRAFDANITGSNNVAIGDSSLFKSTTVSGNTAVGSKAMYTNTTGSNNASFGAYSLRYNTTGSSNTAMGAGTLSSNTTGSNNTAIGYSAMSSSSTYSNSTALGYNAQVTASNQIQLGNNEITDVKTSGVITTRGLGIGTKSNTSAALEVNSSSQGFLPPRMTAAQRDNISTPVAGLVVWCTNCADFGELQVYNGSIWTNMIGGAASIVSSSSTSPPVVVTEADIIFKVEIGGTEVDYSSVRAVVGETQEITVNISSTLPTAGVNLAVIVRKDSDNSTVFSSSMSSTSSTNGAKKVILL